MDFATRTLAVMALIAALWFGMLIVSAELYLSAGDGLLDSRVMGYDITAVNLYLTQLSASEIWFYAGPFRLLGTLAPPLMACTFVGLILKLARTGWRVGVAFPLVYVFADLRENALIGQILSTSSESITPSLVAQASAMTQLKWGFLVLSLGVVLVLWKRERGR